MFSDRRQNKSLPSVNTNQSLEYYDTSTNLLDESLPHDSFTPDTLLFIKTAESVLLCISWLIWQPATPPAFISTLGRVLCWHEGVSKHTCSLYIVKLTGLIYVALVQR